MRDFPVGPSERVFGGDYEGIDDHSRGGVSTFEPIPSADKHACGAIQQNNCNAAIADVEEGGPKRLG